MSGRSLRLTRRAFLQTAAAGLVAPARLRGQTPGRPEARRLYNGILRPDPWPPRRHTLSSLPQRPPYIASPPDVIDIDLGRQLFVDDFLIEESSLHRAFHRAEYHPASPVLVPTEDWERRDPYAESVGTPPSPSAMVFSDGVFHDPSDGLFKMWYMGGYQQHTALAVSRDGISWERPALDVVPGTNIVSAEPRDSSTVWLDLEASSPDERFKMASYSFLHGRLRLHASPDGVHWRFLGEAGISGDRSTCFWNPFLRRWVFSLRADGLAPTQRVRQYLETERFGDTGWRPNQPVLWTAADALDAPRPDLAPRAELYNLDAVAYESVLLGLFTMYRGEQPDREKPNDICVGFSRDGFYWDRTGREPFIRVSDRAGDWNWANVQSAGGCCLVVGDWLYFYVSGRAGVPGTSMPGVCSTGLATLRRDGFASVSDRWPPGVPRLRTTGGATLTTRPVRFTGGHLFVNADAPGGLRVEVLDVQGRVIPPYSLDRAVAVTGDGTRQPVRWQAEDTLDRVAGQPVRFRFTLSDSRLYAFWVSASPRGHSRGYVAAGGPGYAGPTDAG